MSGFALFLVLVSSLTCSQLNAQRDDHLSDLINYEDIQEEGKRGSIYDSSRRYRNLGGVFFPQSRYTFIVVPHRTVGVIGRIRASSRGGLPITYKLITESPHVKLDPHNGELELRYNGSFLSRPGPMATMSYRVAAYVPRTCQRCRYRAVSWVRIIALRRYFGDRILQLFQGKYSFTTRLNKLSRSEVTAGSLHRVVRRISPKTNQFATKMAMAQARLDNACAKASFAIKAYFERQYTSVTMSASMSDLVSPNIIRKLMQESQCPKREIDLSFCTRSAKYRSIDGTCNNLRSRFYGSSSSAYTRLLPAKYYDPDGKKDPLGMPGLPNAPVVPGPLQITKEFVISQQQSPAKTKDHSHFLMQWGQWLDHDFTLAPESEDADECRRVNCRGTLRDYQPPCFTILPHKSSRCIHFTRTAAVCKTSSDELMSREQMNANTAFIDGSQVYGSTQELANNLRDFSPNKGLLRVRKSSNGDLLPLDTSELMFPNNLCRRSGGCFLAGDVRSSEQMALAAMHTIFVREHNRIARQLLKINPHWSGNKTYQEVRKIVGAILQKITYEDFLPEVLGYDVLPKYTGYKYWINPGVINSFAAAAFRYGHSTIRNFFSILDENFRPVGAPIPLKHLFFNNTFINRYGIEPLVFGLCAHESEIVDRKIADGIMHHLFERPNSPGLNLAALNIQRGRDHGLPGYNDFRKYCKMSDAKTFKDTSKEISRENRNILRKLYNDDPSIADLWVAGIAETPLPGSQLGPTFSCLVKEQFIRLRDGDRFFYQKGGVFSNAQLKEIEKVTLSRVLCDNLRNGGRLSVQRNLFHADHRGGIRVPCKQIPGINLNQWRDLTS